MADINPYDAAIGKRQKEAKKKVLDALQEIPIVEYACRKAGIGRTTYYRWYNEDRIFANNCDEALKYGNEHINDLSESQLIQLIRKEKLPAIAMWLKHHSPRYKSQPAWSRPPVEPKAINIFDLVAKVEAERKLIEMNKKH